MKGFTLKNLLLTASVLVSFTLACPANAATSPKETTLKWFGHASFQITTPSGKTLFIDPWITNPTNPKGKEELAGITQADYILITHGHFDHIADAVTLAKKTGAKLIASFELGTNLARVWGFPEAQAQMDTLGNPGGEIRLPGGEVTVTFTPAIHSSGLDFPNAGSGAGKEETRPVAYGGIAVGYLIQIKDGPTIYHSGDTSYFAEMTTLGDTFAPDVSLLNIGGHFGMEPAMAAQAAAALKTKLVVPMHFKTFPILTQDAGPFFGMLDKRKIAHVEMQPGSVIVFQGKKLRK
jgi:L-ascorbate metabolism protein UlaG (beta-lactamase superfamily)